MALHCKTQLWQIWNLEFCVHTQVSWSKGTWRQLKWHSGHLKAVFGCISLCILTLSKARWSSLTFTQGLCLLLLKGMLFSSIMFMDLSIFSCFISLSEITKQRGAGLRRYCLCPFSISSRRDFHMFNLDCNFFTGLVIQMLNLEYSKTDNQRCILFPNARD